MEKHTKYPNEWIMMNFRIWIISRDFMPFKWWSAERLQTHKQGNSKEKSLHFVVCACDKTRNIHSHIIVMMMNKYLPARTCVFIIIFTTGSLLRSLLRTTSNSSVSIFYGMFVVCILCTTHQHSTPDSPPASPNVDVVFFFPFVLIWFVWEECSP